MLNQVSQDIISSKEILERTGISRATLNNYIRMGIIPRPIVQKPIDGNPTIKSLGYFPPSVIERIETVKDLKKQGKPMEEIIRLLTHVPIGKIIEETALPCVPNNADVKQDNKDIGISKVELKVTFEEISCPAYLLNYDFDIEWINSRAENRILTQNLCKSESVGKRNIFKLFFNWEFQSNVKNWKDLVAFHMSFAKLKFSKTWLSKLYKGITLNETRVLEDIYDEVIASTKKTLSDSLINILITEGATERYRVYTVFFKEGILFIYAPSDRSY